LGGDCVLLCLGRRRPIEWSCRRVPFAPYLLFNLVPFAPESRPASYSEFGVRIRAARTSVEGKNRKMRKMTDPRKTSKFEVQTKQEATPKKLHSQQPTITLPRSYYKSKNHRTFGEASFSWASCKFLSCVSTNDP
jgi:hypothetical protein